MQSEENEMRVRERTRKAGGKEWTKMGVDRRVGDLNLVGLERDDRREHASQLLPEIPRERRMSLGSEIIEVEERESGVKLTCRRTRSLGRPLLVFLVRRRGRELVLLLDVLGELVGVS